VNEIGHLILDLDHTLISSFEFGEASVTKQKNVNTVSPILTDHYIDEYGLPEMYHATISSINVLIKLRPHVRRFIKEAHSHGFTLHVYTKGKRVYMNEILNLIDPGLERINGRLISRDDEPVHFRDHHKDLSLVFTNTTDYLHRYIVLDDSPHVWSLSASSFKKGTGRVIEAKRYSFSDRFIAQLRANGPGGSAIGLDHHSQTNRNQKYPRDFDDYLTSVIGMIIPTPSSPTIASSSSSMKVGGYIRTLTTSSTIVGSDEIILEECASSDESWSPMSAWSTTS